MSDCVQNDEEFYSHAENYWSSVPATVDGMLGGYGFISQTDIRDSKLLLKHIFKGKSPPGTQRALDCGAGIGRITKYLLTDYFECVDLVEQNPAFLEQAKQCLSPLVGKIGQYYSSGLQNFHPDTGKYDVVWIQWVVGHLTDSDLVEFLKSCTKGLKPNGVIVVKDNITSSEDADKDETDSSVTRPFSQFKKIFQRANLQCSKQMKQNHFPKGLYTVYMFVLKPITPIVAEGGVEVCSEAREA